MTGDPPRGGAAVAALAPLVGPDLDVHLHEVVRLATALTQSSPARDSDPPVHVGVGSPGKADGLDVGGEPNGVLHGEDGHVVPL